MSNIRYIAHQLSNYGLKIDIYQNFTFFKYNISKLVIHQNFLLLNPSCHMGIRFMGMGSLAYVAKKSKQLAWKDK